MKMDYDYKNSVASVSGYYGYVSQIGFAVDWERVMKFAGNHSNVNVASVVNVVSVVNAVNAVHDC